MTVITLPQAPYNVIATETFGKLEKYVPANDNEPQGAMPTTEESVSYWRNKRREERGQYIGLTRGQQNHRAFVQSVNDWRQTTDRAQAGLDALAELDGYIYLGSPYSKYAAGHDAAARVVAEAAGALMRRGLPIYAPIPHGNSITIAGDLPKDWDFWKRQCDPMIDAAAALVVLTMDGWQESVGLTYEIASFLTANKPMLYLTPADLGVVEKWRAAA